MSELTKSKYSDNEIAKTVDFNYAEDREIKNISSVFEQLAKSTNDTIVFGLEVQERSTPSMNVDIKIGLGFRVAGTEAVYNGSLMGPIAIINGGAQNRIDTLEIRAKETDFDTQQRAFKDPGTGNITYNDVETKTRYEIEAQVVQGTEGSGVAPVHTAGWMKVAEIHVDAGESTAIYNADIKNVTAGKDGEANSAWTIETTATFRLKSLSEIKSLFRTKHKEDGDHADDVIQGQHLDWGTGASQVDADLMSLGTAITHAPTGGAAANLTAASTVRAAVQKILDLLIGLAGVENDAVDERHVNFGTGAGQISAVDIPIADAESRITATEVENALQELAGSGRTTQTIKGNADNLTTHGALTVAGTHGSTVAATANRAVHRDAAGRAKVAAPSASDDIARKADVDIRIPNSLLTAMGDFVVRGTTNPERLAAGVLDTYLKGQGAGAKPIYEKLALRDTGVKIGNDARDSSGDQIITGVGFQPSTIIFLACDSLAAYKNYSWGFDDGTVHMLMSVSNDGVNIEINTIWSMRIERDGSNDIHGYVSALGSDGFTITWAETGTCSMYFIYLCLP